MYYTFSDGLIKIDKSVVKEHENAIYNMALDKVKDVLSLVEDSDGKPLLSLYEISAISNFIDGIKKK